MVRDGASRLLTMRISLSHQITSPHPEEPAEAQAQAGVSKDAGGHASANDTVSASWFETPACGRLLTMRIEGGTLEHVPVDLIHCCPGSAAQHEMVRR